MIKAVKKLKFWSRKKRKKKTHQSYYPPPPPPPYPPPPPPPPPPPRSHCCCSYYSSSTQPSAPPLPPSWFDSDPTHDTFLGHGIHPPAPESSYPNQSKFQEQEIVLDSTTPLYPTLPESTSSYQQYMVPNPVYGIPVSQTARREKSAGVFGCVVNFGIHLIRCFFPCYRIREVR